MSEIFFSGETGVELHFENRLVDAVFVLLSASTHAVSTAILDNIGMFYPDIVVIRARHKLQPNWMETVCTNCTIEPLIVFVLTGRHLLNSF